MKNYKAEFKTNANQEKTFTIVVMASDREAAIREVMAYAQTSRRFVISCKKVK